MRFIPLAGLGVAIWGLFSLDWFKVGFGLLLFFGGFLVDVYRKRSILAKGDLFSVYKPLHELLQVARKMIETSDRNTSDPKTQLAVALFYMGMIDAASQSARLSDKDFLDLWSNLFKDLDIEEPLRSKTLLFHQSLQTKSPAYEAIMKGGEVYTKFARGNEMAVLASGGLIDGFVENPAFPASVEHL
jgi:hypothetical protein